MIFKYIFIFFSLFLFIGITSAAIPSSDFTSNVTYGSFPLSVQFTDNSLNSPTVWSWFFGDELYNQPWIVVNMTPAFVKRSHFGCVILSDGSIVLMGGITTASGLLNDTWRSTDGGKIWTQMNASSGWLKRDELAATVLSDNTIIVVGGGSGAYYNDTWKSTDAGSTWILVNSSSGWEGRYGHKLVALPDDSVILTGGRNTTASKNDTWRSTDKGATWVLINASSGWQPRYEHESLALKDGSIIVMGGSASYFKDVWRSTDNGLTWTRINSSVNWGGGTNGGKVMASSVVMPDGSVLFMGGFNGSAQYTKDVWRSGNNGVTWERVNQSPEWNARYGQSSVVTKNGSVLIIGGYYSGGDWVRDIWNFTPTGSFSQNPTHTYSSLKNYTVSLTSSNNDGYDNELKTDYINPYGSSGSGSSTGSSTYLDRKMNSMSAIIVVGIILVVISTIISLVNVIMKNE
jgi:hypothetical protein